MKHDPPRPGLTFAAVLVFSAVGCRSADRAAAPPAPGSPLGGARSVALVEARAEGVQAALGARSERATERLAEALLGDLRRSGAVDVVDARLPGATTSGAVRLHVLLRELSVGSGTHETTSGGVEGYPLRLRSTTSGCGATATAVGDDGRPLGTVLRNVRKEGVLREYPDERALEGDAVDACVDELARRLAEGLRGR